MVASDIICFAQASSFYEHFFNFVEEASVIHGKKYVIVASVGGGCVLEDSDAKENSWQTTIVKVLKLVFFIPVVLPSRVIKNIFRNQYTFHKINEINNANKEFQKKLVNNNPFILQYISTAIQNELIESDPKIFYYASTYCKKEFIENDKVEHHDYIKSILINDFSRKKELFDFASIKMKVQLLQDDQVSDKITKAIITQNPEWLRNYASKNVQKKLISQQNEKLQRELICDDFYLCLHAHKKIQKESIDWFIYNHLIDDYDSLEIYPKELQRLVLTFHPEMLVYASEDLQIQIVDEDIKLLKYAEGNVQKNILFRDSSEKKFAYANIKVMADYLEKNTHLFSSLDEKTQKEVILEDDVLFEYANEELKKNKSFISEALNNIKLWGNIFCDAHDDVKSDQNIFLKALKERPYLLASVGKNLEITDELLSDALDVNGLCLKFIHPDLGFSSDKNRVLQAMKENPWAFKYASDNLKLDLELQYLAAKGIISDYNGTQEKLKKVHYMACREPTESPSLLPTSSDILEASAKFLKIDKTFGDMFRQAPLLIITDKTNPEDIFFHYKI